jgi:hypothetical protein
MGLFAWLKPAPPQDAAAQARIEHAVAAVDPMIRQTAGYARRLAPAVARAWDYCERLSLAIPGPFSISRAAFASDPLVHAVFGSADDVETMLATSQCVREHVLELTQASGQCCALLGMRSHITAGFGTRLSGEMVQRDASLKTLSFTDHTLAEPGGNLEATQQRLARTMFDGLIKSFAAHVDEARAERQGLRDAQAVERALARASGPESHTRRLEELQERLRETGDALQPARLADTLADYLATPEEALHLELMKLWVDRTGIVAEDADERSHADALRFAELTTRDQRRWAVMIVRIDRAEARAAVERFEERRRYIVI